GDNMNTGLRIEGRNYSANDYPHADFQTITPDYFTALAVPILRGRPLAESDSEKAPPVMLINEEMAKRFWPNEDPIGKRVNPDFNSTKDHWITIVGVVKNTHHFSLTGNPVPEMFFSYPQMPIEYLTLAIRTSVPPLSLAETMKREIAAIDP